MRSARAKLSSLAAFQMLAAWKNSAADRTANPMVKSYNGNDRRACLAQQHSRTLPIIEPLPHHSGYRDPCPTFYAVTITEGIIELKRSSGPEEKAWYPGENRLLEALSKIRIIGIPGQWRVLQYIQEQSNVTLKPKFASRYMELTHPEIIRTESFRENLVRTVRHIGRLLHQALSEVHHDNIK